MTIEERAARAGELKASCNCAQAVVLSYADKLPLEEETLKKLAAGAACPVLPETVASGRSFGDWLLLPLLCRPELTITEIATTVGFSGASYYSEVFRKYTSCSPTEYRKRILSGTQI